MKRLINLFVIVLLFVSCSSDDNGDSGGDEGNGQLTLTVTVDETTDYNAVISWTLEGNTSPVVYEIVLNGQTVREGYTGSMYNLNGLDELTTYNGVVFVLAQNGDQTFANFEFTTILDTTRDGNLRLTSQEAVDNFYFTSVVGNLRIKGDLITDLSNLSSLEQVGNLIIENTSITSLEGLGNLQNFTENEGYVSILSNPYLTDVSALSNLSNNISSLNLINNVSLNDPIGLGLAPNSSLLIIDTPINSLEVFSNATLLGRLRLNNLPTLQSLEGLNNVESIGAIELEDVPQLTNFQGLNNVKYIGSELDLRHTNLLDFSGLENLEILDGQLYVAANENLISFQGLESLQYISGDFQIGLNSSLQDFGNFASLTAIYGNFKINYSPSLTGFDGLNQLTHVAGNLRVLDCPILNSLEGLESFSTTNGSFWLINLPSLETLNGIQNLQENLGVRIEDNTALTDFCGLTNLVNSDSSLFWYVSSNAYNPTKEQVANTDECSI